MKRLVIASALVLILSSLPVRAERPAPAGTGLVTVSPGELKATPEMWFYDQAVRQHQDPKATVRANAEFRNDQRMRRIESMKWFGLSNSRPRASADPVHYDYSPGWASNNGYYPSRWNAAGQPWIYATRQ